MPMVFTIKLQIYRLCTHGRPGGEGTLAPGPPCVDALAMLITAMINNNKDHSRVYVCEFEHVIC